MHITEIANFFILNYFNDIVQKKLICKYTIFFAMCEKSSNFALDFAEGKALQNSEKINSRKGARVVEEARLESE